VPQNALSKETLLAHNVQAKRRCVCLSELASEFGKRNGASTFQIANDCFAFAYAESERRFAVCYTTPLKRTALLNCNTANSALGGGTTSASFTKAGIL